MKTVFVNPERCIGCKQCEIACAVEHSRSKNIYQAILETPKSTRRIHVAPGIHLDTSFPNKCRHCEPAPCKEICPTGAIDRAPDLDTVTLDGYKCITCAMCAMVCPFDVIRFFKSPTVKLDKVVAVKCDHCIERQRQGQEPACVEVCKVGALVFGDINELTRSAATKWARLATIAADEIQPEMMSLPGHIEVWRSLGKSIGQTGKEV
jgi:carbon-monoxide dehydrogenase iron sulfur subunit